MESQESLHTLSRSTVGPMAIEGEGEGEGESVLQESDGGCGGGMPGHVQLGLGQAG